MAFPFRASSSVVSQESVTSFSSSSSSLSSSAMASDRWRPMCLYFAQGMCTKTDDPVHLDSFDHRCSTYLRGHIVDEESLRRLRVQYVDYFLVLPSEGEIEMLEFPVLAIDARSEFFDVFHRFVRPPGMSEQEVNQCVEARYSDKLGVDRVWHETAIPFKEVMEQFENWLMNYGMWTKGKGECLYRVAFVSCGDGDLKAKLAQQCRESGMELPLYFMEWIDLKDAYKDFYKRTATGTAEMMEQLQIPTLESHHLGIDDAKDIARILQRMLIDGACLQIPGRMNNADPPQNVGFLGILQGLLRCLLCLTD